MSGWITERLAVRVAAASLGLFLGPADHGLAQPATPPGPHSPELKIESALQNYDLQFFGDVFVPAGVLNLTKKPHESFTLLRHLRPLIQSGGANIVNFEGAATTAQFSKEEKSHLLRTSMRVPAALSQAGIVGITLANNHSMDYGLQGLFDTIALSEKAKLRTTGAGASEADALRPMIISTDRTTYCIFAISRTFPMSFWATPHRPGTGTVSIKDAPALVSSCDGPHDFVVASVHWGRELSRDVQPYQRALAHAMIDGGAIAVVGHHPHILQEVEVYKGKPIFYSLGNFIFGSRPKVGGQEGMAVGIRRTSDRNFEFRITPINVDNRVVHFVPRLFGPGEEDPVAAFLVNTKGCQVAAAPKQYFCRFVDEVVNAPKKPLPAESHMTPATSEYVPQAADES